MSRILPVVAVFTLVFLLLAGCGDDEENPAGPGPSAAPSVEAFLDTLSSVYSRMDSVAYAACLDSSYEFESLPMHTPDDSLFDFPWDRPFELRIAGTMFDGRYTDDGKRVNRLQLRLTVRLITDAAAGGDSLLTVLALVDLLVVVEDPASDQGISPYVVNSDQIFLIRCAPSARFGWTIVRQTDQMPINKAVPPFGTQESSWTRIKVLFSGYTPPEEGKSGYSRGAAPHGS